jgi:hypothetical protein
LLRAAETRKKIVEVSRLERGVLPIVGEAEELTLLGRNGARAVIHPAQRARHQQGRSGAPPLCRQARELVDLASLTWRLIFASRAEVELARQKPRSAPGSPDCSARIDRDFPWRKAASVAPEPHDAPRASLEPVLGIIVQGRGEHIIGITLRVGHQIARLFSSLCLEWSFVDGTRKDTSNPAVFDENDRMMLLSTVPAKEGRVQPSIGILRVKTLTVERNPPAAPVPAT